MSLIGRIAGLGLVLLATGAQAQDIRTVPVRVPAGATGTVLKGTIAGDQSISYTLGAEAGQTLRIAVKTSSTSLSFNLYAPGKGPGDEALAIGDQQPDPLRFEGALPASGTYTISVFLNRAAARRKARASFSLALSIPGSARPAEGPVKNDFADGLQGGPDRWQVAGVPAGDVLHLRSEPSPRARSVATRSNGATLRNGGCRMVGGQRWCQVETLDAPAARGWAAGRYLREAGAPGTAAPVDLMADCRRYAAVDFGTQPARILPSGSRPGPEGTLVDAIADLGPQGRKPFACRFDKKGLYLGIFSKVNEGSL